MPKRPAPIREYHDDPKALVQEMSDWLEAGERTDDASRVRAWLERAYALGTPRAPRRRRPVSRGSSSR